MDDMQEVYNAASTHFIDLADPRDYNLIPDVVPADPDLHAPGCDRNHFTRELCYAVSTKLLFRHLQMQQSGLTDPETKTDYEVGQEAKWKGVSQQEWLTRSTERTAAARREFNFLVMKERLRREQRKQLKTEKSKDLKDVAVKMEVNTDVEDTGSSEDTFETKVETADDKDGTILSNIMKWLVLTPELGT